jgi:catalase
MGLAPSPALSVLANGPETFAGRKVGVLVTDGADVDIIRTLRSALDKEGANLEVIAPAIGGVELSDGHVLSADQKIDGGPSVLYDSVVVAASDAGVEALIEDPAARDFLTDAYAHYKFIGYNQAALPLFEAAGLAAALDDGIVDLAAGIEGFVTLCRQLRHWDRPGA